MSYFMNFIPPKADPPLAETLCPPYPNPHSDYKFKHIFVPNFLISQFLFFILPKNLYFINYLFGSIRFGILCYQKYDRESDINISLTKFQIFCEKRSNFLCREGLFGLIQNFGVGSVIPTE
ncbi:hypothetical protein A2Y83_02890 [Candidatus Falkowbacteria bacterium RBG_13_39_14]|uniref:Uncharacterized protein n=1 Tax=Candidatus Falkowbacteria bacterium RBG_13_39_14 TaxID=1797985 RepID=A0A1F5S5Q9_9BACT|nr:MAG: hypothetical protein A2Y83_02890 [Candidatus Falkowbacteria bacterium RBG_13_39_14]